MSFKNIIIGVFVLSSLFLSGCFSGSSSVNSRQTNTGGMIAGNVTASGTIDTAANIRFDTKDLFNIAGAELWLQSHPQIRTLSRDDGSFVLENVPFGPTRVVASIKTKDNKVYKTRSGPVEVDPEQPYSQLGNLSVSFASNRVRIILRDASGNPVSNAVLTLWGETCELDGDGVYLSPPLPDSELLEEILIVSAEGVKADSIFAPFTSNGDATLVKTLVSQGSSNKAPNVWLTTVKEPGEKIQAGDVVKMWAVYTDGNSEDLDRMRIEWSLTGGTLASGSEPLPEGHKRRIPNLDWNVARVVSVEWKAPLEPQNYKISVVVTDPSGLSGHALHPLKVHKGNENPPPPALNRPPVAYIVASSTVLTSQRLPLRVIASDPDLDILSFEWSASPSGGSFSSTKNEWVTWTAPSAAGIYELKCRVTEISNAPLSVEATFSVIVQEDPIIVKPGMIAGHVLEAHSRAPIPRALVAISGTNIYRITDDAGFFEFVNLEPGTYTLIATKNGYQVRTYSGITVPAL